MPSKHAASPWRDVAAAFVVLGFAWGVAYSYGVVTDVVAAEFGTGRAASAGVFSLTGLIYFLVGWPAGVLADRIGARRLVLLGGAALCLGLLSMSQASTIGLVYLSYGLGVGLGVGCVYVPLLGHVARRFEGTRRALALGVTVAGIGVGTLLLAPVAAWLIGEVGWRDAYRTIAAGALLVTLLGVVLMRPAAGSGTARLSLTDVVGQRRFGVLYLAGVLMAVAVYVPFVYLPGFAESRGVEPIAAAALVGVIGMASIAGRFFLAAGSMRIGVLRAYRTAFVLVAIAFLIWPLAEGYEALVAFAVVLGFGYGGFIALTPALTAELFGGERLAGVLGVLYTGAGVGTALGPPLAGYAIDATASYVLMAAACSVLVALGWLVLRFIESEERRESRRRERWRGASRRV